VYDLAVVTGTIKAASFPLVFLIMEHLLTSDRRRSDPPEAVDGAAGAESASVWMSSAFMIPTCQQVPLPAPPPSRKRDHPVPKKHFFMSRADKTSAAADTTATSWGEESLGFDPARYAEAEPIGSYPEAAVLWSPVERASSGADYLSLKRDTNRHDFVGGSAAYMGTAGYYEGANPQGGFTSEEVASVWMSSDFIVPTRQQVPLPAPPPSRKRHHPVPKKRFFMSRADKTSAVGNTGTSDFTLWSDRTSAARSSRSATAANQSAFDLPRNVVGNMISLAAMEATYDDVVDLNIEEEEVGGWVLTINVL